VHCPALLKAPRLPHKRIRQSKRFPLSLLVIGLIFPASAGNASAAIGNLPAGVSNTAVGVSNTAVRVDNTAVGVGNTAVGVSNPAAGAGYKKVPAEMALCAPEVQPEPVSNSDLKIPKIAFRRVGNSCNPGATMLGEAGLTTEDGSGIDKETGLPQVELA
jgi:hypothetical protein